MRPIYLCLSLLGAAACSTTQKPVDPIDGNVAPVVGSVTLEPEPAYEGSELNCQALGVVDDDGDPVDLAYAWNVNAAGIAAVTPTLDGNDFSRGDLVFCTVTPSDASWTGAPVLSNTVTIQNTAPIGASVDVTPTPATVLDSLVAQPLGFFDADGDEELWRYSWFINGVAAGADTNTLSNGYVKGDVVYVIVTPDDRTEQGDPIQSIDIDIMNSPPALATAEVQPTLPSADDILVCVPDGPSDADNDIVAYNFEWFVNGGAAGTNTDLLAPPNFVRGDSVYCVITPTDGQDDGAPVASGAVAIANSLPVVGTAVLSPDPAFENTVLTCAAAGLSDGDNDPVTLNFSWTVGGVPSAASTSTLDGADFDRGQAVQCTITPNDGIGQGNPTVSNLVVISNSPPSATLATVTPAGLRTDDDADAVIVGWNDLDGDIENYQYQWYIDGLPAVGETTSTLASSNFVKHQLLSVEATPWDGIDLGAPLLSADVEVLNTPPGPPIVAVTPSTPDVIDTLVCSITVGSSDMDFDPVSYAYNWTVNGAPYAMATNIVPTGDTQFGELWECIVTPNDGEDDGAIATDMVIITDATAPDTPILDALDPFSNDVDVDITGTAEPGSTVTITATCDMGSDGVDQVVADPSGDFALVWNMQPGETCDFWAEAEDGFGNVSPPSNIVITTICASLDPWEGAGYGDNPGVPVDEWPAMPDDGLGAFILEGNMAGSDPGDWFIITTVDDNASDIVAGADYYDFRVQLTAGAGVFTYIVHKGGVGGFEECPAMITGYDDYNDYYVDQGDAPDHVQAVPGESCGSGSATLNDCEDHSNTYYIQMIRDPIAPADCTPYEVTVTNNAP